MSTRPDPQVPLYVLIYELEQGLLRRGALTPALHGWLVDLVTRSCEAGRQQGLREQVISKEGADAPRL